MNTITLSDQALAKLRYLVDEEYNTWARRGDDPDLDALADAINERTSQ